MPRRLVCTLAARREAAGLTFRDLARLTGLSDPALCQYENGRNVPSVHAALLIAGVFGCRVEDLWRLEDGPGVLSYQI